MNRHVMGALTAALIAGSAGAQVVPYAYEAKVFTTVDEVSVNASAIVVTGIVEGEQAPSTWAASAASTTTPMEWASACQRSALIAMAKPGQYRLEIKASTGYTIPVCKLSRVAP